MFMYKLGNGTVTNVPFLLCCEIVSMVTGTAFLAI